MKTKKRQVLSLILQPLFYIRGDRLQLDKIMEQLRCLRLKEPEVLTQDQRTGFHSLIGTGSVRVGSYYHSKPNLVTDTICSVG